MTLSEFRTSIRLYVPAAKTQRITNPTLDTLINEAVNDVNIRALAYKGNKKINVVADISEYKWSDEISDYACLDESGIWWNAGSASSPNWIEMDPMTRKVLDLEFPRWKDDSSDDPRRYITENDTLTFNPPPNTTLSEGFWVFFIKVATAMTSGAQYPFTGTTTEITSLRVLDDAIIDYVRWKLAKPLGKDEKGLISERDYRTNLAERIILLRRNPAITTNKNTRMRGPTIG